MQIILICEECCLRLRETHQFLEKCSKNSARLRSYMDNLNTTPISNTTNTAELLVQLNITHEEINEKYDVQSEDKEIYTFQWRPNIAQIEDVFVDFEYSLIKEGIICKQEVVDEPDDNNSTEIIEEREDGVVNLEDYFVKEEDTWKHWKREAVDDTEEHPMDDNSTETMDNECDSEISASDNAHLTNADGVSSELARKQVHATNKKDLNTAATKSFQCSTCNKCFKQTSSLVNHMRIHTGEKPYVCSTCKKCFAQRSTLVRHMCIHTGDKPYSCSRCKKYFVQRSTLVRHMQLHTGDKPYSCSRCKKSFAYHSNLVRHMQIHTGDKPYSCSRCKKCFTRRSTLVCHMQVHTGDKSYSCSRCKKCFARRATLGNHMRVHTRDKL